MAARDPQTREEWQAAVDAAHACLCLDSARQYGLVKGGPAVDARRCEEILERGREMGIFAGEDAVERLVREAAEPGPPGDRERAAADLL